MINKTQRFRWRSLAAACSTLVLVPAAQAAELDVGPGKLRVTGSAYLGMTVRTDERDEKLVPGINASRIGASGNAVNAIAGRNQDDGNLNYDKGDIVSQVLKGYITLDYKVQNYGVMASAKGWYDYAQVQRDVSWGNSSNGYVPNTPLSDEGAIQRSKFGAFALDNLYLYGNNQIDNVKLDWMAGNQKISWGNRYVAFGGLQDINPLDIPAATRPGVIRGEETRMAFPALFASVGLPNQTTRIEGFYQLRFQRNVPNQCGTFYSQLDFVAEGCNAVFLSQNLSDAQLLSANNYIKRADTEEPSNKGQGGLALKHTVESLGTEFGAYAVQMHSRAAFYNAIKGSSPNYNPNNTSVNAKYFIDFPEEIKMYALSFDTKFKGGAVFGEFSYRPNQPLQYNAQDLLAALTRSTAPTPLRAAADATAAGGKFAGWERHEAIQLQLGAGAGIPNVLGASALTFGGELIYKLIPDLPDQSTIRFGRADVFGQGPVNGVCNTNPAAGGSNDAQLTCTNDGYVSRSSWGYRLRAALPYKNVMPGVEMLTPSIFFGHDVKGWSADQGINQGRMLAILALNADFAGGMTAGVNWQPTWGGDYNNLRDRSVAQAWVGYKF